MVPEVRDGVALAPPEEGLRGVLGSDEGEDGPEGAGPAVLFPRLQVQLADVEEHNQVDHVPLH